MDYIIVILVSILFQVGFNWISDKIDYSYSSTYKWLAVASNIIVWILLFEKFDWSITFGLVALASTLLISSSFVDLTYKEIPNSYNLGVALLGLGFVFFYKEYYQELLLGGVLTFILFLFIMIVSGAMGGGDVKMAGAIGFFLGIGLIVKFMTYAFLSGAIAGVILLVIKRKGMNEVFPFGPFIAISAIYLFIFYV